MKQKWLKLWINEKIMIIIEKLILSFCSWWIQLAIHYKWTYKKNIASLSLRTLESFANKSLIFSLVSMFISWICWSSKQLAQLSTYVNFLKVSTLIYYSNTTIYGFSKDPSWLTSLFLLIDMYILTIAQGLNDNCSFYW
jgi:hypothetical protein